MSQNYEDIFQPIISIFSSSQLESMLYAWLPTRMDDFFPKLRTNIYSVDTFFITSIVTLIIAGSKIFYKFFEDGWNFMGKKEGMISVLVEYDTLDPYGDSTVNKHHQGLSWLISQKAKEKNKGSYVMVPDLEIDYKWGEPPFFNILPQTENEIEIEHEGRKYVVSFVGANSGGENKDNNQGGNNAMANTRKLPSILIRTSDKDVNKCNVDFMSTFLHNVTKSYLDYEQSKRTVVRSRYEYNQGGYWSRTCTLPDIKGLETVALKKDFEELIPKDIEAFLENRDFYLRVGFPYRRGYLLHGRPGTGKTSLVNAIAAKMNRNLYFMNLKDVKSDTELLSAFSCIPSETIVVFEDVDTQSKVLHSRAAKAQKESILESFLFGGESGKQQGPENAENKDKDKDKKDKHGGFGGFGSSFEPFSLSTMLSILDGRTLEEGILFIMTTNHSDILDPAVIRPGRMDVHLNLDYCTHYQLNRMYQIIVEDNTASLRDIYPDYEAEIPELVLPPCEVMQMMVLHRTDPKNIKTGLIEITKQYCDGSIWEDEVTLLSKAEQEKAQEVPPAIEEGAVDLNTVAGSRTIAVQVNITSMKEFGIQAGHDDTIKKLEPKKPKSEVEESKAKEIETQTTTTETETQTTTTETEEALSVEKPQADVEAPIADSKLVYKAVKAIQKSEKGESKEDDNDSGVSEDGFSVVPSPM